MNRYFFFFFVTIALHARDITPDEAVRISTQVINSVIGIAVDPHNPQHVAASVQNIISSFAYLIEQAVKRLEIEDPEFVHAENRVERIANELVRMGVTDLSADDTESLPIS